MEDDILVSVRVVSYNAEKTILETLNSVKNQTYRNIELIISDDCSKDKTVETARKWIEENKDRFIRTVLLTVDHNTGIPANANRTLKVINGQWIKGIAADDILLPNCIQEYVNYVKEHPDENWLTSKYKVYNNHFNECNFDALSTESVFSQKYISRFSLPIEQFLKSVAFVPGLATPTHFISKAMSDSVGEYLEKYKLCEDYPMAILRFEAGYKPIFLDFYSVGYRRNTYSLTSTSGGKIFNYAYSECEHQIQKDMAYKYLNFSQRVFCSGLFKIKYFMYKNKMDNRTVFNAWIFRSSRAILNAFCRILSLFNNSNQQLNCCD